MTTFGWRLPVDGRVQDLFNLPVNNVEDNDLVTQAVGMKYKPSGNYEFGLAYEFRY